MPDPDAEFLHAVAKATTALIIAHELGDPERAIAALNRLLAVVTEHGTIESRKAAALACAVERINQR